MFSKWAALLHLSLIGPVCVSTPRLGKDPGKAGVGLTLQTDQIKATSDSHYLTSG